MGTIWSFRTCCGKSKSRRPQKVQQSTSSNVETEVQDATNQADQWREEFKKRSEEDREKFRKKSEIASENAKRATRTVIASAIVCGGSLAKQTLTVENKVTISKAISVFIHDDGENWTKDKECDFKTLADDTMNKLAYQCMVLTHYNSSDPEREKELLEIFGSAEILPGKPKIFFLQRRSPTQDQNETIPERMAKNVLIVRVNEPSFVRAFAEKLQTHYRSFDFESILRITTDEMEKICDNFYFSVEGNLLRKIYLQGIIDASEEPEHNGKDPATKYESI